MIFPCVICGKSHADLSSALVCCVNMAALSTPTRLTPTGPRETKIERRNRLRREAVARSKRRGHEQ